MKIIYKSDDGTEFETEKECTSYESKNKLLMWECDGKPTNKAANATFLYIPNEKYSKVFIKLCKEHNDGFISYDGIEENDWGFFVWDEINEKYVWTDFDILKIAWKLAHETCPEEFEGEK